MKRLIITIMMSAFLTTTACSGNGNSGILPLPITTGDVDTTESLINDYEGTVVGAEWVPGIIGDALQFNGYDQYVYLPDHEDLELTHEGTVEAWIFANSHNAYAGIVHKGEYKNFSDEAFTLQFWGTNGTVLISLINEAGERIMLYSETRVETENWYHIAATWNEEEVRLYINGTLDSSVENTIRAIRNNESSIIIGAQLNNPYNENWGHLGFDGLIDEVNIHRAALSEEEISDYYTGVTGYTNEE